MRNKVVALLALVLCAAAQATGAERIVSRSTPHLSFKAALSPDVVAPGSRMSLRVDVVPKKGVHVYAPGTKYRPIAIALETDSSIATSPASYPKPSVYVFEPLKEEVLVYSDPFTLTMDVAVADVPRTTSRLKIRGTLSYQACDDRICYLPQTIPMEWTVGVKPR